jgi:hypothetical protein
MFTKREVWTEAQVKALPPGEHDYFDRKSGLLFGDTNELLNAIAKAASAFANSGGGHLVLGVTDAGSVDGVPMLVGSTATRDWLEQKVPDLLEFRLKDFRVHSAIRAEPSDIPVGRDLIVIDIGDSALAPHQSRRHRGQYYYRSGSHSLPAPHFYLELLRQRLTSASLDFDLRRVDIEEAWRHEGSLMLRFVAHFEVKNTGRIAAYKWALVPRRLFQIPDDRVDDYFFGPIPGSGGRNSSFRVDDTILSGCWCNETKVFGVRLRPAAATEEQVRAELVSMIGLTLQLATETSPGEEKEVAVGTLVDTKSVLSLLRSKGLVQIEPA